MWFLRHIITVVTCIWWHFCSWCTVYPKKYAHGFCFAVLCCGYTLTDFPVSIRLTSLALLQSNDCPSVSKATQMNMDKYFRWIHYERLHNHNKAKHNKTMCIFLGIYCKYVKCENLIALTYLQSYLRLQIPTPWKKRLNKKKCVYSCEGAVHPKKCALAPITCRVTSLQLKYCFLCRSWSALVQDVIEWREQPTHSCVKQCRLNASIHIHSTGQRCIKIHVLSNNTTSKIYRNNMEAVSWLLALHEEIYLSSANSRQRSPLV